MESYPTDYVVHNLPLVLLSGLGTSKQSQAEGPDRAKPLLQEGGFKLSTTLPELRGSAPDLLLDTILQFDGTLLPWSGQPGLSEDPISRFKFLTVGRTYTLPARKAPPPPRSPRLAANTGSAPPPLVLHSPLSPLTPSSPLFPDGMVSPLWITKHESRLPSAYICFSSLTGDPNISSLEDNKLKAEINNIRVGLTITNYKTKLVVVLIGSDRIDSAELEERLGTTRRACNLEAKSLYFLPHGSSRVEVKEFVKSLLATIRPFCVEYYRDLSKHARRKRNRTSIPPPTIPPHSGTSRLLPAQGWLVRYEFKLGVLAEFRQEMDAACRNYETAYETLFGPEVFGALAAWNPRFDEARMLADIIALRIIRCLLWVGEHVLAVRSWSAHGGRIGDLVNRRGKGTKSYGWPAWESNWAKAMAQLIAKADLSELGSRIYMALDPNQVADEGTLPWEQLHHQGYWLQLASKHTQRRRELAMQMPEEDRHPPGQSPASAIASKAHTYDTYLVPQPHEEFPAGDKSGYDYSKSILSDLNEAMRAFRKHHQHRLIQYLQLMIAVETSSNADTDKDTTVADSPLLMLKDLWERHTTRITGWWQLLENAGQTIHEISDTSFGVRMSIELQNAVFDANIGEEAIKAQVTDPQFGMSKTALTNTTTLLATSVTFAFASAEGNVGEPAPCQLCLLSLVAKGKSSPRITSIQVSFDQGLKPILFEHDSSTTTDKASEVMLDIQLSQALASKEGDDSPEKADIFHGHANLLVRTQPKVLSFSIVPQDAGTFSVSAIEVNLRDEVKEWTEIIHPNPSEAGEWWEIKQNQAVPRPFGMERDTTSLNVLPKPPKLVVEIPDLRKAYYTNELIELYINITNDEEIDVVGTIDARLISPVQNAARLCWKDEAQSSTELVQSTSGVLALPQRQLESMIPGSRTMLAIILSDTSQAVDHELGIVIKYHLSSDSTTLVKTLTVDIPVVRPFEANYTFSPRLHPDPWPNFFDAPSGSDDPTGLKQSFEVTSNIYSFADEPLTIVAIILVADKIAGGATCSSTTGILLDPKSTQSTHQTDSNSESQISATIQPETTSSFLFSLFLHRLILGARSPVSLDLALEIGWKRPKSDVVNTTVLEVPRFTTPMSEPRVLLLTSQDRDTSPDDGVQAHNLRFVIENPSMHFLTFNVTMESSEELAFSGPKSQSVSLVPVSRTEVVYRVLPLVATEKGIGEGKDKDGQWVRIGVNVVDAYFGQTLRVIPAGEAVKIDRGGLWLKID